MRDRVHLIGFWLVFIRKFIEFYIRSAKVLPIGIDRVLKGILQVFYNNMIEFRQEVDRVLAGFNQKVDRLLHRIGFRQEVDRVQIESCSGLDRRFVGFRQEVDMVLAGFYQEVDIILHMICKRFANKKLIGFENEVYRVFIMN